MESPTKHHFNPACSLKPWAGEDDNVCQMRKINGQVIPRRVHPNATGFERDLYRIDGVKPELAQHVETNFCPATIKMVMRDNQDGKVVAGLAA